MDDFINETSYKGRICIVKIVFFLSIMALAVSMVALNIEKIIVIVNTDLNS